MRNPPHLIVLLLLSLLLGCRYGASPDEHAPRTVEFSCDDCDTTTAHGRVVTDTAFLASPRSVARVGDHLAVLDTQGDTLVHVVEQQSGRYVGAWGTKGSGPGDLSSAWDYARQPSDERGIWIFDFQLQRLTYFDIASFLSGEKQADTPRLISLPVDDGRAGRALQMTATPDGRFAATGFFTDGRVRIFDENGEVVSTLGPVPPGEAKDRSAEETPVTIRQQANRGVVRSHPEERVVAVGLRFFDRIELINLDDTTVTSVVGPVGFEPEYVVRQGQAGPVMARTAESRFGYVDVTVTDAFVFGLYSGKSVAEMDDFDHSHYGRHIVVLDWTGDVIRVIEVDDLLSSIYVDAERSVLYGIRDYPTPAILEYPISVSREGGSKTTE